jgi:L-ascorbate metabolism protein UlaG (beta-lactamase superfamily)
MKLRFIILGSVFLVVTILASCSFYQPLDDRELYGGPMKAPGNVDGVTVTYFGNSTILISDGKTSLLVDGFFSRPNPLRTLFGRVSPDKRIIQEQLKLGGISHLDALLIGHSHFDHALDAPTVACLTGAVAMGSKSYFNVQAGGPCAKDKYIKVPPDGIRGQAFGQFRVSFLPSRHIAPHLPGQREATGEIEHPIRPPARATDYKHGDVFAIHICHPHGQIAITTTADAHRGQFRGYHADVLMLAVGLLEKETEYQREFYWKETAGELRPKNVIPIHWDSFARRLPKDPSPRRSLAVTSLKYFQNVKPVMDFVKMQSAGRDLWLMGLRDSFLLRNGKVESDLRQSGQSSPVSPDQHRCS